MTPQRTIHRYRLAITDRQTVRMPAGASLLAVAASRSLPTGLDLWAVVATARTAVDRVLLIVGTGNPFPDDAGPHVGTVVTPGGLVWHVFEGSVDSPIPSVLEVPQ